MIPLVWLAACGGEAKDGGPTLTGTIEVAGSVGEVRNAVAFGVNTGGQAALYVSADPDTTCDHVGDYLAGVTSDFNPDLVHAEGACGVYVYVPTYSGSITVEDDAAAATISLACAMDEGTWEVSGGDGYEGYYYSGPYWTGVPQSFSLTLEGGDEGDFDLTLDMDDYNGSFIYDTENADPDPGSGAVTGSATVTWCPDIGPSLAR